MSDSRWVDIEDDADVAAEHFRFAVAIYETGDFEAAGLEGYKSRMAFMHAVQSGHTSLEALLLRILDLLNEERPTGDRWHRDLILRACRAMTGSNGRPSIFSQELCAALDETRRFRNLAVRGYERFRIADAEATVAAARLIAERLVEETIRFKGVVDAK